MDWKGLIRCDLSFGERFALAWRLAWRIALIDVAVLSVAFLFLGTRLNDVFVAYSLIATLVVYPFVVRQVIPRRYEQFRVRVLSDGEETEMDYTQSFKVAWLLGWRSELLVYALLLVISPLAQLLPFQLSSLVPKAQEAPWTNVVGLSLLMNLAGLILWPLVMPGMLSKRYNGFHLAVDRNRTAPRVVKTASRGKQRV
ncbi:MAG: hypothetical protein SFV51_00725 [Bryobacteraceae bacterium]|nr:hypothetical protein [Bryobacteraceae bacterium]